MLYKIAAEILKTFVVEKSQLHRTKVSSEIYFEMDYHINYIIKITKIDYNYKK